MNIQRFHAPTSRQALAKARLAFGEGTLILSNRPTAHGVEVMATAEDMLSTPDSDGQPPGATPPRSNRNPVQEDTERLTMSTLSFQDYVRERMLHRRHEAGGPAPAPSGQHHDRDPGRAPIPGPGLDRAPTPATEPALALHGIPMDSPPAQRRQDAAAIHPPAPPLSHGVTHQLHAMQALIEDRLDTLAWLGQARQHPIQSQLMLKLIRAAYSPTLARAVLERMPPALSAGEAVRWLLQVLAHNLQTDQDRPPLHQQGGVFALLGTSGVGKTSTCARLAALCAGSHGPGSVGLITLGTTGAGAHEPLHHHARMLGMVAHPAHDRAALHDLLGLLGGKKLVLIDTPGLAPRDPRQRELLALLDLPSIERLLLLNAGCHGDTLDEMLGACKSAAAPAAVILSKLDEAVKLGPAIDALIRHQLLLRGLTRGQRIPEDWAQADAQQLVSASMRAPTRSAWDPQAAELGFFFAPAPDTMAHRG